uniref:Uncharacterized protein n=1 Tax=Anopheles dirus TaxID=7168 RepID=A0A182NSL7_9DIPT
MADLSSFQRSSPLRTPIRTSKLKLHKQKQQHSTDVPPLARQLLRSLNNNDRRNSFSSCRLAIGQTTVRRNPVCPLDQSCMDQFDDSFAPELDHIQPLTPRKSPHLLRRGSLTHLGPKARIAHTTAAAVQVGASRKRFGGVRKRVMNSVRKMLLPRRTSSGYMKL